MDMKLKILLVLNTILLVSIYGAKAQTRQLKGNVIDSINNKPIEFVTLILRENKSNNVKSTISTANGTFTFFGLKPVEYLLTVVAQGFKEKNVTVNLTNDTKEIKNIGSIYTVEETHHLNEIVVTANKPIAKQEIDRIVYNMQSDPDSKSSSVLEIIRKVPLLSVDGDNTIRLKGNKNYKIFINGKPSTILDRNPQNILRNMQASSIEKLEVITTVPAKYDAEALDGIINIITIKKIIDGYSGNVNVSHGLIMGGPGVGGSFTVKDGKVGVSGFLGGSLFDSPSTTNSSKRHTSTTTLLQSTGVKLNSRNAYFGSAISYEVDSLNLLSGQFNISGNRNNTNGDLNSELTSFTSPAERYKLISNNMLKGANFDASLDYQKGFKIDKNRLLTLSYRVLETDNYRTGNFDVTDAFLYQSPDYNQSNNERSLEHSFQIDYFHPFKKLILEAGAKGIIRNNISNFLYDTLGTNQIYAIDEKLSNKFNNTQDIIGLYNSCQYKLNRWGFKAGVRVERATINADFISNDMQVKRIYLDYIPSVSVQKQFKNNTSLLLGYSRKIRRPEIKHLNPFLDRSNPNFESSGNPSLQPASSNSLELSYSSFKKLSLYVRLNCELNFKMVLPTLVYDEVDNITRSTLENTARMRMVGTMIYINYPLTSRWNTTANLMTIYGKIDGLVNNIKVSNQRVMYYFSASTSYSFDKGWSAAGSVNLNGADINLQGIENSAYRGCGFSVTKKFLKDKCYFTAQSSNPFSEYRNNTSKTNSTTFNQEITNQRYLRSFSASLSYRFGGLKSNLMKNKKGIVNDDSGISPY